MYNTLFEMVDMFFSCAGYVTMQVIYGILLMYLLLKKCAGFTYIVVVSCGGILLDVLYARFLHGSVEDLQQL